MPSKAWIIHIIGLFLQYGFMCLLYYFLYRLTKNIYTDLTHLQIVPLSSLSSVKQDIIPLKLRIIDQGEHTFDCSEFELKEVVTIGRTRNNNIMIPDAFVSHEHACITKDKYGYWLSDLQSTNGTYYNDHRVDETTLLQPGDTIKISSVIFTIER